MTNTGRRMVHLTLSFLFTSIAAHDKITTTTPCHAVMTVISDNKTEQNHAMKVRKKYITCVRPKWRTSLFLCLAPPHPHQLVVSHFKIIYSIMYVSRQ